MVTDAGYGIPSFRRALDERQVPYVCTVAYDFGVRLPTEWHKQPLNRPNRRCADAVSPRSRVRLLATRHTAHGTRAYADLPEEAWQTVQWRDGSRGFLRKQFVALRVHAGTSCARHSETHGRTWTGPEGWLLGERPLLGEESEPRWFFSSLPADTAISRLVELAHLRWPIE